MNNCFIEITNKCNLLCKHCFNSSGSIKNEEIALKTLEDIIDKIIDKGVDVITITGGEVQLYSKLNSLIHFILIVIGSIGSVVNERANILESMSDE